MLKILSNTTITPQRQSDYGPLANLLRRVQAAAEVVERGIYDLDAVLCEFEGDVPDEIWNAAANVSTILENTNSDVLGAIEDLYAAVGTR